MSRDSMLRGNVVPPKLEAAIFRALKQVPGVELTTVDALDRPGELGGSRSGRSP